MNNDREPPADCELQLLGLERANDRSEFGDDVNWAIHLAELCHRIICGESP